MFCTQTNMYICTLWVPQYIYTYTYVYIERDQEEKATICEGILHVCIRLCEQDLTARMREMWQLLPSTACTHSIECVLSRCKVFSLGTFSYFILELNMALKIVDFYLLLDGGRLISFVWYHQTVWPHGLDPCLELNDFLRSLLIT